MPGVGKSTIGVILAKILGMNFVDTDLIIQNEKHMLLREIIEKEGTDGFIAVENGINSRLDVKDSVIATGGSIIYGPEAMANLKKNGDVIYLEQSLSRIEKRLSNIGNRGVVVKDGQTFADLYTERCALYEKYADVTVHEGDMDIENTIAEIRKLMPERDILAGKA